MKNTTKEYWVDTDKTKEELIRLYLLKNSDALRLTRMEQTTLGLFYIKKLVEDDDPFFLAVVKNLEKDFLKKVINNKRFNDLPQGKNSKYQHYFYKLSANIKKMLDKETLFWWVMPPKNDSFYGFEDPSFYKKGKMIGSIISHEMYVALYLSVKEKIALENKDFIFYQEK
ncbi:MAG: hypothetical protein Q7S22_02735 [Candidatus Micrarchaeota archaeon]|nr:hypothetical protein [Candidatus Micrarchaeota archaeon]